MCNAHAGGKDDQAPEEAAVRQKHLEVVAEEGSCDCEPMCGGILQPMGVRRGGICQGGGDIKIPGKDVGPVRRQRAGCLPHCWEGAPSVEPDRETAKERGGGPASVINVISGSVPGVITIWGGDLGFVGGNVPEAGESASGIPQTDYGAEVKVVEVQDLENRGSGKGAQRSEHPDTGDVH